MTRIQTADDLRAMLDECRLDGLDARLSPNELWLDPAVRRPVHLRVDMHGRGTDLIYYVGDPRPASILAAARAHRREWKRATAQMTANLAAERENQR